MVPAIHQFVPTFEPGATGAHMVELQRLIREDLGLESEIFAEHIRGSSADGFGGAHPHSAYGRAVAAGHDDVLVYQMAIGSVVADFVRDRVTDRGHRRRLVLNHHNFTPPRFLQPWAEGVTYGVTWGEAQLRELAPVTALGVAVSDFNRLELERAGYEPTAVVPVLVDLDRMGTRVDTALEAKLKETKRGSDWFFIGRIAPNKCQHDLVKSFAAYRQLFDPGARLWLTGGSASASYTAAIEGMVRDLGLSDAVHLTGPLPQDQVAAHFRAADAFVLLSEHEGFCVPILEAWWHRLPVVAYSAAAVPETLGDGGLLLRDKRPLTVATAVDRVVRDPLVTQGLVEQGARRLEQFTLARTRSRFVDVLRPLLS